MTGRKAAVITGIGGGLTPGPLEVLPPDVLRHGVEVNVLGALQVINSFLPALRTAQGRVVHAPVRAFLDDDAEVVLRLPAKKCGTSRDELRLDSAPRA
ncbi:hypothetical protein GCM10023080_078350 [Streptomyces pseudoechinosporeus]